MQNNRAEEGNCSVHKKQEKKLPTEIKALEDNIHPKSMAMHNKPKKDYSNAIQPKGMENSSLSYCT